MSALSTLFSSISKGLVSIPKYNLASYFLKSGLIALLLLILVIFLGWNLGGYMGALLGNIFPSLGENSTGILKWTGRIASFVLTFILFKYLVLIATGPLMSKMSEKIEDKYAPGMTRANMSLTYSINRGIRLSVRNLLVEILITIPLLLMNLIPVIGFIAPFLILIVQAYYAGIGTMDFTLERFKTVKETTQFGKNNRLLTTSYGALYLVILLIPIVGVFISPVVSTAISAHGTIDLLKVESF